MSKRFLVLLVVFAVAATMIVPAYAQDDGVTLRWRTRPDNQAEIDVYQAASDSIDEAWDGVSLEYEPGTNEGAGYQTTLINEIENGTAPDVFWIPGTDVARFAKAGLILNLAEYDAADDSFSTDDFYPQVMQHVTVSLDGEDALWGVPRDVSAFAVYYNADLFDEAGIDYPADQDEWDWDAFLTAAEEIDALSDDVTGFGMNAWWANWGYWVNAAGSGFFSEDFRSCGLNNDETVTGLQFAADLFANDLAVPWGEDAEPGFLNGNVGMFLNGRWATPGAIANADFNWNVAELPIGPDGPSNWLFWGAYVVNANTEHPEEAWELVTQLTSADVQGSITALGANIPSRVGGTAVDDFLATFPDEGVNNEAFLNGLGYGVAEAPLWFGSWSDVDTAYADGVSQVFNGELSAQEFADTICDQVDQYFESE